jgi:D-alanyl-lipoteichoic acid acyltransferase DltB (MBOAT superfamily)
MAVLFIGLLCGYVLLAANKFMPKSSVWLMRLFWMSVVILFGILKFKVVFHLFNNVLNLDGDFVKSLFPLLGFSFLAVKLFSFFVEVSAGRVKTINPIDYLVYFTFFPTFLSGPITRYPAFTKSVTAAAKSPTHWSVWQTQLPRFLIGCVKVFAVAGILKGLALPFLTDKELTVLMTVYIGAIAYYWYEYINFSGYSDLAISSSKVLGIEVPENFNYPFMATSLTDLWRRWHITLAHWLRDYIYYPLLFTLSKYLKPKGKLVNSILAAVSIFITFTICGFWHGEALGMILFGVLSGFVLGVETILTQNIGPKFKKFMKGRETLKLFYNGGARILTFHIALLTFGPVLLSNEQLKIVGATLKTVFGGT